MANLDIILIGAIAGLLLARLWFVLGRRHDDEPQRPNPFATPAPTPKAEKKDEEEEAQRRLPPPYLSPAGHALGSLEGDIDQIKAIDPTFVEREFLREAKTAFTQIVGAFARDDLPSVASILDSAVLARFQQALAASPSSSTKIERIDEAEVTAARVENTRAFLTVRFVSVQSRAARDSFGRTMSDGTTQTEEIRDMWTFTRDAKAGETAWRVVETKSG